ncbi:hypothetical protein EYZ11_007937 [Aspergillus tanneri]|uniref:BZIP domain-containing protein n=1 Tax=Aspergillus tanneri TaxID=1220188 RepID=A0A4V3UNU4_9EURO|nr:hypothetical protein EYZ11_007937 [Aspergillus tanneri]
MEMSEPLDITIETKPLTISSRRRLQNRMAQRRFRERRASKKRLEAETTLEWPMTMPYMMDDSFAESATLTGPDGLGSMDSLIGDLSGHLPSYDINSSSEDDVLTVSAKSDPPRGTADPNTNFPSEPLHLSAVSAAISGFAPSRAGLDDGFGTSSLLGQVHPHLFNVTVDAQPGYPPSLTDERSPENAGRGREQMVDNSDWSADGIILASHMGHGHSRSEGSITTATTASPTSLPPLLHVGVRSGNRSVVATLLKHGAAGVDERDQQGCTALHVAVALGDKDLVLTLLQHGANVHSRDAHGRSPLYLAVSEGHNEILELLLRYASVTSR